jgi:hypothetical protein
VWAECLWASSSAGGTLRFAMSSAAVERGMLGEVVGARPDAGRGRFRWCEGVRHAAGGDATD